LLSLKIITAFILDSALGDPHSFPHPVIFIGKAISGLEKFFRKIMPERLGGVLMVLIVVSATFTTAYLVSSVAAIIEVFLMYTIFAARCLAKEAMNIHRSLTEGNIDDARKAVSYLVSRDTEHMTRDDIIKATVETVSENIVDGITAPMFYLFIGGAAGGMTYKSINTMDSMVGYKNEKYIKFGWAAARLDDIANFIPARITGLIIIPIASIFARRDFINSWRIFFRDRKKHSSPNSAHSESPVAGALNIQLGGKTSYFGEIKDKPTIGDFKRELQADDIYETVRLMYYSSVTALAIGASAYTTITEIIWK